ncbi:hypothetical protein THAOC_24381, partial [Thalassiosira oceanica]
MKIEVARSAYQVALSKALGPGFTERPSGRPGEVREACFRRKFGFGLRQKAPFVGITRPLGGPRIVSCGPNPTMSSEWDEKQLPGIVSPSSTSRSQSTNSGTSRLGAGASRKTRDALRRRPKTDAARPGPSRRRRHAGVMAAAV